MFRKKNTQKFIQKNKLLLTYLKKKVKQKPGICKTIDIKKY